MVGREIVPNGDMEIIQQNRYTSAFCGRVLRQSSEYITHLSIGNYEVVSVTGDNLTTTQLI